MAKSTQKEATEKGRLLAQPGSVVVRMYRQGLGDCFLLAFGGSSPEHRETRYVLIDCGVHMRQDDGHERLAAVLSNLWQATGGQLDVVVATHEHADHLSGFVQKGSPFLQQQFAIIQLWLAWTEKRGDGLADKLRERRGTARKIIERAVETATHAAAIAVAGQQQGLQALAHQLKANIEFERTSDEADNEAALHLIQDADEDRLRARGLMRLIGGHYSPSASSGELRAAEKSSDKPSSNELALGLLQAQAEHVNYCRPGDLLKIEGIADVRVHVLGPPHDETKLKKDLPSVIRGAREGGDHYKETYLSTASQSLSFGLSPALGADLVDRTRYPDDLRNPFDSTRRRPLDFSFPEDNQFDNMSAATRQLLDARYYKADLGWRRIDADWLSASADLALNLDSDTNNTSLVLAFEWKDRVLLFAADAQVGNWLSWRDQDYKDERGKATVPVEDLLARTLLYKVGHHGSHNATLKRDPNKVTRAFPLGVPYGLELMRDIVALIPVDRHSVEKSMPNPWEMPHQPLYESLREKAQRRVLRSDAKPNVRPLPSSSPPDVTPQSTKLQAIPDLPGGKWRRSEETLSGPDDPLFYEIVFT